MNKDLKDRPSETGMPPEDERTVQIQKLQGEKKQRRHRKKLGGTVSGVVKTATYLTFVTLIGAILAVFVIFVANDVFALKKSEEEIEVHIDAFADINVVAEELYEKDVIRYPTLFRVYAALRNKSDRNFTEGDYVVSPSMGYDALLSAFVPHTGKREQISLTIPEGYCVDDIIELFVENGIGTKEGFTKEINEGDFDYWFLEDVPKVTEEGGRFYRLEGYLYPDTYYFYTDSSEREVLTKLLDNFKNKFKKKYRERCEELGYTMEEVLILASLIQAEARYESDYTTVSSVFHNRLKSASLNYTLQSDATIQYYFLHTEGSKHEKVTLEDLQTVTPYNSYLNTGLPIGPITNPTISAISAAMYPGESSYYYFVTDAAGYCLYAKTYEGHLANIKKVEEEEILAGDDGSDEET